MTIRKKVNILSLIFITIAIIFSVFRKYITYNYFYGFLLALIHSSFLLFLLTRRCPKCKKSLIINPIKIFGQETYLPTFYVPKKCSECGYDLEKYEN